MPLVLKLLLLFVLGGAAGRLVVWASWVLTAGQRTPAPGRPARQRREETLPRGPAWLPFFGSWRQPTASRQAGPAGLRPLVVELGLGAAFAALYWWEVECGGLVRPMLPAGFGLGPGDRFALQAACFSHLLLIVFMLAATLVDIDEQTIPDLIVVPGTLIGLLLAALLPPSLLPVVVEGTNSPALDFLTVSSPQAWPTVLSPRPNAASLGIAVACFLGWCAALLPWRLRRRRGLYRGLRLVVARWSSDPLSLLMFCIAGVGSVGILAAWWVGGETWRGLLSAIVGMAAGGALIWGVRIAAGWALGREAMGFGDVTLMAMIGSFLGWQSCPIVFFLAPVAGLLVGLVQWFVYRDNVIPYGPFLCLAALAVVVRWGAIWAWVEPLHDVPWLVPGAMAACMILLTVLLGAWRALRSLLGGAN